MQACGVRKKGCVAIKTLWNNWYQLLQEGAFDELLPTHLADQAHQSLAGSQTHTIVFGRKVGNMNSDPDPFVDQHSMSLRSCQGQPDEIISGGAKSRAIVTSAVRELLGRPLRKLLQGMNRMSEFRGHSPNLNRAYQKGEHP